MHRVGLLSTLFLLGCAPVEQGVESTERNDIDKMLRVETDEVFVLSAKPTWHLEGDLTTSSEIFSDDRITTDGRSFLIREAIPKGESFDDWSELYAITIEHPLTGEIDDYVGGLASRYDDDCNDFSMQQSRTTPPNVRFIMFYCGQEKSNPGRGEVAAFVFQMTGDVLVKNYHHVRVDPFDPAQNEIAISVERLTSIVSNVSKLQVLEK